MKTSLTLVIFAMVSLSGSALAQSRSYPPPPTPNSSCPTAYQDTNKSVIPLDGREISSNRLLTRDPFDGSGPRVSSFLATRWQSGYWSTECPVFLGDGFVHSGNACKKHVVFSRRSALTIRDDGQGSFTVWLSNVTIDGQPQNYIVGTFRPKSLRGLNLGFQTGWLESDSQIEGLDFFVFLQDTRFLPTGHPINYKAFRVEAFPPITTEPTCDTHRPERALCGYDDGRIECASQSLIASTPEAKLLSTSLTTEADTGGGHEPPP